MGQVLSSIIVILVIIFIFIPLALLNGNNADIRDLKQDLSLSSRVLCNCISSEETNLENLADGYERPKEEDIYVDKTRLINEFNEILYKNIGIKSKYNEIKSRLLIKVLVYCDRFYIADECDNWSPPFFFTIINESCGPVYFNVKSNKVYYYVGNAKVHKAAADFNIDEETRNNIIISSINNKVTQYTYDILNQKGLNICIQNPHSTNIDYKIKHSYFNILDGVSFFVVYGSDKRININSKDFKYKNYSVAGYTMEVG